MEENAKTYLELVNRLEDVKDAIKKQNYGIAMDVLYKPYPVFQVTAHSELKESEDERIRGAIIDHLKDNNLTEWAAWLEKQGEPIDINPSEFDLRLNKLLKQFENLPKEELASSLSFYLNVVQNDGTYKDEEKQGEQKETLCDKCRKEQPSHSCQDITELGRCAVEREQKPADKVEPKFHEGDFIVNKEGNVYKVVGVCDIVENEYRLRRLSDNGFIRASISVVDKRCHFWNITEDAKDGDVLASDNKTCPFIYRTKTVFGNPVAYCGVRSDGLFISESPEYHQWCLDSEVIPATKEQHDLLFKNMKEAGYEWDAEKKELKKIEQKSATMSLGEAIEHCKEKSCGNNACALEHKQLEKWLTELKELKEQKPAWSKEDEDNMIMVEDGLSDYIDCIWKDSNLTKHQKNSLKEEVTGYVDWLKSLKERVQPQNTWKPSDVQMKQLSWVAEQNKDNMIGKELISLYKDLKKLKG